MASLPNTLVLDSASNPDVASTVDAVASWTPEETYQILLTVTGATAANGKATMQVVSAEPQEMEEAEEPETETMPAPGMGKMAKGVGKVAGEMAGMMK
jgi:hypothetical protein